MKKATEDLAYLIASRLEAALAARPRASLVVPGGRSPRELFEALCPIALDWKRVDILLADERWTDPGSPDSNEHLVRALLLRERAAAARFHPLKSPDADPVQGAVLAWQRLAAIPRPFDVVVLGIGEDGHFASLFPGDDIGLDPDAQPACVAVKAPRAPHERVTLNLAALLESRQIEVLVQGPAKWQVFEAAREAGPAEAIPLRALIRQTRVPVSIHGGPG